MRFKLSMLLLVVLAFSSGCCLMRGEQTEFYGSAPCCPSACASPCSP